MNRGCRGLARGVLALLCMAPLSCTDTALYSTQDPRRQADRVALRGRVCTEDPVQARFPLRVILMVDQAAGPLYSSFDVAGERFAPLETLIQSALANPDAELAVLGYAGQPRKLAPGEGDFTRNPGELINAVAQLTLAQTCVVEERCRDRREALRTARSLVEGDLAASSDGKRVLTQYVVIMVDGGEASPTARGASCCRPGDAACVDAGGAPSDACEALLEAAEVSALREAVVRSGAAGLRLHTIQLAALADASRNDAQQRILEAVAFAGGGSFQRFNSAGGLSFPALDLLGLRTGLRAKLLIAANLNAKPSARGPLLDSDGDGLSDEEEEALGTRPDMMDSDGDGVTDYVETLVGLDPTVPDAPRSCDRFPIGADSDLDGLTDCDEILLGTSPTLVDTDGDGLPDRLEVLGLTDYLNPDAELDYDGDGVNNGDELLLRSDPRSTDTRQHLSSGYRYEVEDEGLTRELFAATPLQVTGVELAALSTGTTPGVGSLFWDPVAGTLRWQDALDASAGPVVPVDRVTGGVYQLPSSSWAPIQGDDGRVVTARVTPAELSPQPASESIRVVFRERQCLNYTIRNVRLLPTLARADGTPAGVNDLRLYFVQAPEGRLSSPGPVRQAQVPVRFTPPATRQPDGALLLVQDEEFVRPD